MSDKLIEQWGALSPDSRFTDSAELALRAGVFERQIRRRNLIEFLAGAIVIVLFARSAWAASNASHAFLALGHLVEIHQDADAMVAPWMPSRPVLEPT